MDEYRTERSTCYPSDFVMWREQGLMEISPKFQRRPVWRTPARSFFIDTLLRGMTVPPLYFRMVRDKTKNKTVREVVDGQQRVRSVLDFLDDGFRLSKTLKKGTPWAGKKFSELSEEEQELIMKFTFPAEMFKAISDQQILEVFCRLNMNGVALNKQELRNGKFFGAFKHCSFDLALTYLAFWRKHRIFSEMGIARMLEVELTSELLIAGNKGMQDKKKSIDTVYEEWEAKYPDRERDEKRFKATILAISVAFPGDELANSEFRRAPLFYSLYCVVFHHMFGLPGMLRQSPKKSLNPQQLEGLREAVEALSYKIALSKNPKVEIPKKYQSFVEACSRGQTDNIGPRKVRFDSLYDEAF